MLQWLDIEFVQVMLLFWSTILFLIYLHPNNLNFLYISHYFVASLVNSAAAIVQYKYLANPLK